MRPVCKSSDHLFVPILEVTAPLLRCIHCNVFAYHETVKQLAKTRGYHPEGEALKASNGFSSKNTIPPEAHGYWRRIWLSLRRNLGFA
jgi:hypothetical protein